MFDELECSSSELISLYDYPSTLKKSTPEAPNDAHMVTLPLPS